MEVEQTLQSKKTKTKNNNKQTSRQWSTKITTEKISNINHIKNGLWTQVFRKDKQFVFHYWHP